NDKLVEQTIETFTGEPLSVTSTATASAAGTQDIAVTDNDKTGRASSRGTTGVTEGASPANVFATLTLSTAGPGDAKLAVPVSANLPTTNADYTSEGVACAGDAESAAMQKCVITAVNDKLVEQTIETFTGEPLSVTSTATASAAGTQDIAVTDND